VRGLGALALLALLGTLAAFLTWGVEVCDDHSADSLLPALMSRLKVTAYYWGQNRFGNLLPLLTSPVSDLRANLQVQIFLRAASAFSIPYFVFFLIGGRRLRFAKFCFAIAAIFATHSDLGVRTLWTFAQPYGQSVALLLAGLHLGSRPRSATRSARSLSFVAASALFAIAFWVNLSLALLVTPIFVLVWCFDDRRTHAPVLIQLLIALCLAFLHALQFGASYSSLSFEWGNFVEVLSRIGESVSSERVFVGKVASIPLLAAVQRSVERWRGDRDPDPLPRMSVTRVAAVYVSCVGFLLIIPHAEWIRTNDYSFRYFLLVSAVIDCMAVSLGVDILLTLRGRELGKSARQAIHGLSAALLIVAVVSRTGPISGSCTFNERHEEAVLFAQKAIESGTTMLIGDYWMVWPTVFEMIESRDREPKAQVAEVFGVAHRGEAMAEEILASLHQGRTRAALCVDYSLGNCRAEWKAFGERLGASFPELVPDEEGEIGSGGRYLILRVRASGSAGLRQRGQ